MRSILVACAFLLLAGCTGSEIQKEGGPAAGVPPGGGTPPPLNGAGFPTTYTFDTAMLASGAYEHARLDAFTGATIFWHNNDDTVHTVTSDNDSWPEAGAIVPGDTWGWTFTAVGDYSYHCRYHPAMQGIVVVR